MPAPQANLQRVGPDTVPTSCTKNHSLYLMPCVALGTHSISVIVLVPILVKCKDALPGVDCRHPSHICNAGGGERGQHD